MKNKSWTLQNQTLLVLDTAILVIGLWAPLAPNFLAKGIVSATFLYILIRSANRSVIKKYTIFKLTVLILLFPGIVWATTLSPYDAIRFLPILLLVFCFPFNFLKLKFEFLGATSFLIILFLVFGQIGILLGNDFALSFREKFYAIDQNLWSNSSEYHVANTIFYRFREFRAAGFLYNPNLYSLLISLYLFIFFQILYKNDFLQLNGYNFLKGFIFIFVGAMVVFSIYLSGSRTGLLVVLIYFAIILSMNLKIEGIFYAATLLFFFLFSCLFFVIYNKEAFWSKAFGPEGSIGIKLSVVREYLYQAETVNIISGGEFFILLDTEFSYWLAAGGVLGLVGVGLFYLFYFWNVVALRSIVLCLLLTSLTNSVFYGLQSGVVATLLFVIVTNYQYRSRQAVPAQFSRLIKPTP